MNRYTIEYCVRRTLLHGTGCVGDGGRSSCSVVFNRFICKTFFITLFYEQNEKTEKFEDRKTIKKKQKKKQKHKLRVIEHMWTYKNLSRPPRQRSYIIIYYITRRIAMYTLVNQHTRVMRSVGIREKKKLPVLPSVHAHDYKRPRLLLFKYFHVRNRVKRSLFSSPPSPWARIRIYYADVWSIYLLVWYLYIYLHIR